MMITVLRKSTERTWLSVKRPSSKICSKIPFGSIDAETGFRNESVTQLTFQDSSLDFILSFDVFEHVPDYCAALQETYRCLKPGGTLLFTVPFNMAAAATQVRAKINADGTI